MGKVVFKAKVKEFKNGCLLLPATPADKRILDAFCRESMDRYITVTANHAKNDKTYDQCKTVFALSAIIFECNYGRRPNGEENKSMYEALLREYAPREPDLLHPEVLVPVSLSKMSKIQAMNFINCLMSLIIENCDLTPDQQIDVRQLFIEFKKNSSVGKGNPCDYDENGNLLSEAEWRERNNVSMCTGIGGEDIELCHIVTKGARPDLRDLPWNWLAMSRFEHREIQHKQGWETLLQLYPHLGPRVKNAFIQGHQLIPIDVQKGLEAIGLWECD